MKDPNFVAEEEEETFGTESANTISECERVKSI
jgi:hypothetical protein